MSEERNDSGPPPNSQPPSTPVNNDRRNSATLFEEGIDLGIFKRISIDTKTGRISFETQTNPGPSGTGGGTATTNIDVPQGTVQTSLNNETFSGVLPSDELKPMPSVMNFGRDYSEMPNIPLPQPKDFPDNPGLPSMNNQTASGGLISNQSNASTNNDPLQGYQPPIGYSSQQGMYGGSSYDTDSEFPPTKSKVNFRNEPEYSMIADPVVNADIGSVRNPTSNEGLGSTINFVPPENVSSNSPLPPISPSMIQSPPPPSPPPTYVPPTTPPPPAPSTESRDTAADKEWISKFENFAIKFLNKIFRRTQHERKLREAVKFPGSCRKKTAGFVPTANAGVYPYSTFQPIPQLQGFQETTVRETTQTEAEEEAQVSADLNSMLDELKQVVANISPQYLSQVSPLFQTLVELRGRDFRRTDNREIYRRIDDYASLIKCDAHICLETVMSRLQALVQFVSRVKEESANLKKFPRILTKCYSTESRICQEVCEVYSDDEFQTVNIKKMCKLKPKCPERPPWRLTYKIGRECFPGMDYKQEPCAPGPSTKCGATCGVPQQKLFTTPPKCDNPVPCHAKDNCFGTPGGQGKWKNTQFPCNAKNTCKKQSCCKGRVDPKTCCTAGRRKKKKKMKSDQCTTTCLPGGIGNLRVPPGVDKSDFTDVMTDFYGTVQQVCSGTQPGMCRQLMQRGVGGGMQTQTEPAVDKRRMELELQRKQEEDQKRFEEKLRRDRMEFDEGLNRKTMAFEESQQGRPPEVAMEVRQMFEKQLNTERQQFEQSMMSQWNDFKGAKQQEREELSRGNMRALQQFPQQQQPGFSGNSGFGQNQGFSQNSGFSPSQSQGFSQNQGFQQSPQGYSGGGSGFNFTQMNVQLHQNIESGFRNIGMDKGVYGQHGQQTDPGFNAFLPNKINLMSKQQQTFRPFEQFRPYTGQALQEELKTCLQMSNNTLADCLAKLSPTGDGPGDISIKQKEEVYNSFIAQMHAAGNISKADADRMTNLVKTKLLMETSNDVNSPGGRRNQKEAQCTLAESDMPAMTEHSKYMHVCDGCPRGTMRGYSSPARVYATTRTYQSGARGDLQHMRGWQNPDGSYATGALCLSTDPRGLHREPECPQICPPKPKYDQCGPEPTVQKPFPKPQPPPPPRHYSTCKVRSFPLMFKAPQCPNQNWADKRPNCCAFSEPNIPFPEICTPKFQVAPVVLSNIEIPDLPPPPPPFRDPTPPPSPPESLKSGGGGTQKDSPAGSFHTERSLSLTSHPSPPASVSEASGDEQGSDGPPPPPKKKGPYKSPFKFHKHKPPEPDCRTSFDNLPECHPLKRPYPPQYRFDEVRMRRYMEQCGLLKEMCAKPDQCWVPPPPPIPPELMPRKNPFEDPCFENLFPGADLGKGCGYGLSSGRCFGPYGKKARKPKPEDCFFDCGGICPMGLLGEKCEEPKVPAYSKLKKKKKEDEYFTFDYITVMRDKRKPESEQEQYCDLYKQKRDNMMKQGDQCCGKPPLEIEIEAPKGRRGVDDNCNPPPVPNEEITRFLLRPDVQVVKEQKTEIVKKHGCEGPEKMVTQMEAYYTRTNDGKIKGEVKDRTNDANANAIDQWMKQDAEANLKKLNRANCNNDCPRDTDWEKEFKEFAKSCNRPKKKVRGPNLKPMPAGFIPCPLPTEPAPIMCRVENPTDLSSGGPTIRCQAIPFPLANVIGNTLGPDGRCPLTLSVPPFGMPPPPGSYGGYVMGAKNPPPGMLVQDGRMNLPQGQEGRTALSQGQEGWLAQDKMYPPGASASASGTGWSSRAPGPNGSVRFAPGQPVVAPLRQPSYPKQAYPKKNRKSDDYPYMCEIRYHEPIQGSIYGRVVSRKQPCRLIDPDTGLPPDHNPECPVIMETPYFNPSCPVKEQNQGQPPPPPPSQDDRPQNQQYLNQ